MLRSQFFFLFFLRCCGAPNTSGVSRGGFRGPPELKNLPQNVIRITEKGEVNLLHKKFSHSNSPPPLRKLFDYCNGILTPITSLTGEPTGCEPFRSVLDSQAFLLLPHCAVRTTGTLPTTSLAVGAIVWKQLARRLEILSWGRVGHKCTRGNPLHMSIIILLLTPVNPL